MSKRKSNKAKGDRIEKLAQDTLESWGFNVFRAKRTMRCIGPNRWISQEIDVFACDLIAIRKDQPTHFIQVTALGAISKREKAFSQYPFNLDKSEVQCWYYQGHNKWKIMRWNGKQLVDHALLQKGQMFTCNEGNDNVQEQPILENEQEAKDETLEEGFIE